MKYLLTILITLFTLTANAQSGSIGVDNMYLNVSDIDGYKSVHAEVAHIQPIFGPIVTRAGVGVGFSEFQSTKMEVSDMKFTEDNLRLNINPSVMAGIRIPVHPTIKLGVYTGYHSNINKVDVTHHFVPLSISVSFVNIR